jgi:prolyl-tRNA synthetase
MRLSSFFLPVSKNNPQDAQIISHRLMIRSGMIYQNTSGIYSYLPLAQRVIQNLERIIEAGLNKIGCQRITMPTIQPASLWVESGRYGDYGKEMLRFQDRHDRPLVYGPTHEEVVTDIARAYIKSYRQLPKTLYQIHWKFRDEIRPRFGVMRGREFLMKDAYSFDETEQGARQTYENIFNAYLDIFNMMGLHVIPLKADPGPIGGDLSHEFHVLANTGESALYYDQAFHDLQPQDMTMEKLTQLYAMSDDQHDPYQCPIPKEKLQSKRGIEVGHVFYFGDKYTKSMRMTIVNRNGDQIYPQMGSYGIGVTRLLAAIIESSHDAQGIIWPKEVTPFQVGLINLKENHTTKADDLYTVLLNHHISCLYDDTDEGVGKKFSTMDLIGLPLQIIIGDKIQENLIEFKIRQTGDRHIISVNDAIGFIKDFYG